MLNSEPSADMDPQMLDGIAAQMTSGQGEWDVVTEVGDDMDCEDLGKSDFAIQTAGFGGISGFVDPIYQIDYAAECRYEKDMQTRARKVENILLKLVRNKAHAHVISNTRPHVSRQLAAGEPVPTYVRKLMKLPQDWQIEEHKRRILKENNGRRLHEEDVYDMAFGNATDAMDLGIGSGVGDSENAMYTPEQAAKVEPLEEVAQFVASECGSGTYDQGFCDGMNDMMKAYHSYETEEYFKARADPRRLQTLIHMGLSYKDSKELLDTVRDMFMVPKPGDGPQGPGQNDKDECPNLYDQHLGCYDLAWMSTDYSDWQNPKLDDSPTSPHNRCKAYANQVRQTVAMRKEDKPLQKALLQVMKQLGRWDLPDNFWTNAMSAGTKLTNQQITDRCTAFYDGNGSYGASSAASWEAIATGYGTSYAPAANEPTAIKDILKCPEALSYGTTALPAEEGYYRCFEAKWQFQYECENLLGFLNNQMTVPEGNSGPFGQWRSAWDADSIRRSLQFELDPDYQEDWHPFKKVGSKLATCSLKAVRHFIPEAKMMETMRDMEEGKIKPETVFKHLVEPEIEKLENVRDVDEALKIQKETSPVCKEFCAAHGAWQAKADSQDPFTWAAHDVPEPVYDTVNGYAGAYDYGYDATTVTGSTTLPPSGDCRVEVECALYEILDAPDTKQSMHNAVLEKDRRRMRRQRRLAIEERRRRRALQDAKALEAPQPEQMCVTLDGSKYCREGGDPFAEHRRLAEEKRRELHEYMEERGISMVVPALSSTHEPTPRKQMSAREIHNRRKHV
jgi:hypothetical protein